MNIGGGTVTIKLTQKTFKEQGQDCLVLNKLSYHK